MYAPQLIQPVVTASSSNGAQTPDLAVDGDTSTYWESNNETNPYIQIDLTMILSVDRVVITFDSVNRPSSFNILTTDNPTDQEYGQFSGAFDLQRGSLTPVTGDNVYTWTAKNFRYLRIQMNGTGQMRIKEIGVWAPTGIIQRTVSRMKINTTGLSTPATYFTNQGADLIEVHLDEGPVGDRSEHINQVTFKLNNANISSLGVITDKYLQTNYPTGSRTIVWLDGVLKLFGNLVEFIPDYGKGGFFVNGTVRDFGEFLINQKRRQAWAGVTYSDQNAASDVISGGINSLLGMCINSAGSRYFPGRFDNSGNSLGYTNIASTLAGPNTVQYLKSNNVPIWTMIGKIADAALDGAWTIQDPTITRTSQTNIAQSGTITNGYWTGYKTNSQYSVLIGGNDAGGIAGATIDVTAGLIPGGAGGPAPGLNNSPTNIGGVLSPYDGSLANEKNLVYAEIIQPCFVKIAQLNQSASLSASIDFGNKNVFITVDNSNKSQAADMIVETIAVSGETRRLHYLFPALGTGGATTCSPPTNSPTPPDTQTDGYLTSFSRGGASTNLYADYLAKFPDGANDIVTTIRVRVVPMVPDLSVIVCGGIALASITVTSLSLTPFSGTKTPPVRYDYYVTTTLSAGTLVPDLAFFPRPRPGVDNTIFVPGLTSVGGRLLDDTNTIRFYTDFPRSDLNNMESFRISQADLYTTKNEMTATGTSTIEVANNQQIPARDATYLNGAPPYHGRGPPQVTIFDANSMATSGRRTDSIDIGSPDPSEVTRAALSAFNQTNTAITRGVVKTRGNPYLSPGFVVFLDSSFSNIAGYWYIISAKHDWTVDGYFTELTVSNDRFRFSSELLKLQLDIFNAGFQASNTQGTGSKEQKAFGKTGADLDGIETSPYVEQNSIGQPSLRFPLWFVPEFSCIKRVNVTTTRLMDKIVAGIPGGFSFGFGGWDVANPYISGWSGATTEDKINPNSAPGPSFLAQRVVLPVTATSSARMLIRIEGRIPNGQSFTPNTYLQMALYNETQAYQGLTPENIIVFIPALFNAALRNSPNVFQNPYVPLGAGGWINVPFSAIQQAGTDAIEGGANTNHIYAEFENQNLFIPGQVYWLVMKTISANGNLYIQTKDNAVNTNGYSLPMSQSNTGAAGSGAANWASLATGNHTAQLVAYPQKALSSITVTAKTNSVGTGGQGYGTPVNLIIYEPVSGKGYAARSVHTYEQTLSVIDFPTATIARRNSRGDVDVAFPASVGDQLPGYRSPGVGAPGGQNIARWDYTVDVQYEKF